MSKNSNSEHEVELKMYDLYVQRHIAEANVMWSRFKIYLSLNSGVLLVIGFFLEGFTSNLGRIPWVLWALFLGLSLMGWYVGEAWERISADSRRWQLLISESIGEMEKVLLGEGGGLYTNILKEYESTKGVKEDAADTSIRVATFFKRIWVGAALGGEKEDVADTSIRVATFFKRIWVGAALAFAGGLIWSIYRMMFCCEG
jgi:hypothetical protein